MNTPTTENAQQAEKGSVPLSQTRTGVREGFRCIADAEVLIRALVKAKEDKDTTRLIDMLQRLNKIKMKDSLLNSTEVRELRKHECKECQEIVEGFGEKWKGRPCAFQAVSPRAILGASQRKQR